VFHLGGVNAITQVVDRFSDDIIKNPKLNVNPQLAKWNQSGRLPALKSVRTLWVCEVAGGPFHYTGKDMHSAHESLRLTSDEFDEVSKEIAAALDHFGVPEREKGTVLGAIVAQKGQVVNG
jgi:hemoglobin